MSIYDIHFCRYDELSDLQKFLDSHWRKGHVLSYSKELFEFQHNNPNKDYYDYVIARNTESGEIDAILGFIETHKYDTTQSVPNNAWGAIWKVRDDVHNKEIGKLGLKLLKYIIINGGTEAYAALGISGINKRIAQSLNFQVDEMRHYYIVNEDVDNYVVAKNPIKGTNSLLKSLEVECINDFEELDIPNTLNPFKNKIYFVNRYKNHPYYKYIFFIIKDDLEIKALMSVRKISVLDRAIYRIIDMIGDFPVNGSIYQSIQQILKRAGVEYIDCMNYGISPQLFQNLGFQLAPSDNSIVIPEHLDPLEHTYSPLEFEYTGDRSIVIFKGDGDQDRPNKV